MAEQQSGKKTSVMTLVAIWWIAVFLSGGLFLFHAACLPVQAWLGHDLPIMSAIMLEERGVCMIYTIHETFYRRKLENIVVEKRTDGQAHTSADFSLTGVTLLVVMDEDVEVWRSTIQQAKAKHAAYLESLKPQRVLPR